MFYSAFNIVHRYAEGKKASGPQWIGFKSHFHVLWEHVESRKEEEFWRDVIRKQGYWSPVELAKEALKWSHRFLENVPHRELDSEEFE